jgi:hypothetical protein
MDRNRTLGFVVGGIAAVSLIVIVIAALGEDTASFDPDSPEAVVQGYVTAVADGDWAEAHSFFTADLAERCTVSELSVERMDDVARVSIDDVSITGQSAVVDVTVTHSSVDDPLSTSTWDEDVTFVLVDEGGWVFDEISWPYFPCRWDEP